MHVQKAPNGICKEGSEGAPQKEWGSPWDLPLVRTPESRLRQLFCFPRFKFMQVEPVLGKHAVVKNGSAGEDSAGPALPP